MVSRIEPHTHGKYYTYIRLSVYWRIHLNTLVVDEYTHCTLHALIGGHLISKFMVFRIVVNCEM